MFGRKKTKKPVIDLTGKIPVIRASICTGEKVAGFQDPQTGTFEDVMLIKGPEDLEAFKAEYRIGDQPLKTIY